MLPKTEGVMVFTLQIAAVTSFVTAVYSVDNALPPGGAGAYVDGFRVQCLILGQLRQHLSAVCCPGILQPSHTHNPSYTCAIPQSGDSWWYSLVKLAAVRRCLTCFVQQVSKAREEQSH